MIYIDARRNWWGNNPPDQKMISGENINIKPWLKKRRQQGFSGKSLTVEGDEQIQYV